MSTKSYQFGSLSYRIETMRTVDGIDRAGLILATDATGFQSASAPWDLTPCDADPTDTGSEQARAKA